MKISHKLKNKAVKEYLGILILRTIGNFLVISSLFFIGRTFYKPIKEEIRYFIDTKINKKYIVGVPEELKKISLKEEDKAPKGLLAQSLHMKTVEILAPADPKYSIVIPKIGANAKIIPNIDAANEKIYLEALNYGVAHTLGTAFPGEGGHVFLFAHSTDYFWNVGTYNAVFYLLYKLDKGDEVNLFYKGQRYRYQVIGKEIVDPSRVEFLTRKTNKEFLTLQTCWPLGTTLKRLLVFAVRVTE